MTGVEVFTEWVRLFSYSTIMLCIFFEIKLKRYGAVILMGDFIVVSSLFVSLIQSKFGVTNEIIRPTILTLSVFIWMLIHLYNTLKVSHK